MKVLVISAAFPPMRAGEATYTFHLTQRLAERELEVHLLTTENSLAASRLPIRVYPVMQNWSWSELPRFARIVKECSPDAVLLVFIDWIYRSHPMITFIPTVAKALLPGIPLVTIFMNPIGTSPYKPFDPTRLLRRVVSHWAGQKKVNYRFGTLLCDSHRLIVLSKRHQDYLTKLYPAVYSKIVLIPPPPIMQMRLPNNGASRQRGRELIGLGANDFLIAYIGYIYPNKGVETLLRAFQIVSSERNNIWLILVGGIIALEFPNRPSYAQEMYELPKQLGIDDKVTWTGEYTWDSDEASMYLHAADICVFPFDTGIQLNNSSFSSAAAHGLPIITTQGAILGQPFINQENGFLGPPKAPEAIASAITTLMDNPDLRQRLRTGVLKLAQEWFSWENAIERTIEALSTAL